MQASFVRTEITPPVGTPMMGWGDPGKRRSSSVHDPLYLRLCWLSHEGRNSLIVALDWCFVSCGDTRRFRTALASELGLKASEILVAVSHTHSGPEVGTYLNQEADAEPYIQRVEQAMVDAARHAKNNLVPARLSASVGRTALPMNRRQPATGVVLNGPNPDGETYDRLPVCLIRDENDRPIVLLFAASTHPVCMQSNAFSADYPGVATEILDRHLGGACAMFLQGMGGDSRPVHLAEGDGWKVNPGAAETQAVGKQLAGEVIGVLDELEPVVPAVHAALVETQWLLEPAPDRDALVPIMSGTHAMRARWARSMLDQLDRGPLPSHVSIALQGIQIGENIRLIALEGEPMSTQGKIIEEVFPTGAPGSATFALGYANGEGLYLATTAMLAEGGYESVSYWEFGWPAPLAAGNEQVLRDGLATLRSKGIT